MRNFLGEKSFVVFSFAVVVTDTELLKKQGGKKCDFHTNFCNRRRMNAKLAGGVEMGMRISNLKSV